MQELPSTADSAPASSGSGSARTSGGRTSQLRAVAAEADRSLAGMMVDFLVQSIDAPGEAESLRGHHSLLAVCPTSEAVARAALTAAERAGAPLLYAATLNQVDRDGGYTGWTPHEFASFVNREADRLGVTVPVMLGLDHGGPWKKDAHVQEGLDYESTLAEVKASLRACIDAGYELLHLDPTADLRLPDGHPVPIPDIVDRTVELMQFAEDVRTDLGRPPIAYEVGTEEVGGGLQSEDRFRSYLTHLSDALAESDLPRPHFVVGDVGTKLDTTHFNAVRARRLTAEAQSEIGALLKGHYTDDVDNLADYPLSGMGGANVGPGLAAVERNVLSELVSLEEHVCPDEQTSGLGDALRQAVVDSGRWRKWLRPEEEGLPFDALADDRQRWLVATGSRYVWTAPRVEAARERLYDNVAPYRNARAFVQWRLESEITRYLHAFNLYGLVANMESWAEKASDA